MKKLITSVLVAIAAVSVVYYSNHAPTLEMRALTTANVEALSSGESGAKCPNGCSDIGWGWNKILECDCNYDHLSCCDKWGC